MAGDRETLRYGSGAKIACMRELRGEDEEFVGGADGGTLAALHLLDRLLVAPEGAAGVRPAAADLTAADRDRVLAAVLERAFGASVSSTVRCARCEARFDLDFSLRDLAAAADAEAAAAGILLGADGTLALPDGRRYRLPTGRDECACLRLAPDEAARAMLEACALDGVRPGDDETVPTLMRAAAPVLDTELDARCPECGAAQSIRFDVQSYLLAALAGEALQLTAEVHRLAKAYGWSRREILRLPRSRRRAHVALVEAEHAVRRQAAP